jgi:5-formyltetrahydrofolate cyclo-ligase
VTSEREKAALRVRLRGLRRRLAAAQPDAALRAAGQLPRERLPAVDVFGAYFAQGSEMDPRPLIRRLEDAGARCALPVAADREGRLEFRLWRAGEALVPDAVGVPSPLPQAQVVHPRLVIAPLLAFDRQGGRLGQGGGHYDRTLANLRASGPVFVLGLAYSGQETTAIPMEPHDQRLDAILTEDGLIEVG